MVQDLQRLIREPWKGGGKKKQPPALFQVTFHTLQCTQWLTLSIYEVRNNKMPQFLRILPTRATGGWRCRGRASDEGNESRRNLGQREREGGRRGERATGARRITTGRVWIIESRFTACTLWECRGEGALISLALAFQLCITINDMNCFTMTRVEPRVAHFLLAGTKVD